MDPPIDLSNNIQSQIKIKFGNESHMVFSDAIPSKDCRETNLAMIAAEKAEARETEKIRLRREKAEEQAQNNMALANREEKTRLYIEKKFIEKRDKENYQIMMAASGGHYEHELEEKFKNKVLDNLKDPESARFKKLKMIDYGKALCGLVNAKNSFGGYVGFKNFVSDDEGAYIEVDSTRTEDWERFKANQIFLKKASIYGCG